MTISYTNLFTALGHYFGGVADINSLRGGTATTNVASGASMKTRRNTIFANLTTLGRQDTASLVDTQFEAWKSAQAGWTSYMSQLASLTIVNVANADAPLTSLTITAALTELIKQMAGSSASVNASSAAVGAKSSVGSPTGTPIFVASIIDGSGVSREYILPETLRFTCTNDAYGTNGATSGNEPLSITGQAVVSDTFSQDWPGGSGCSLSVNAADATKDNGTSGNLLVNSDFETFTTTDYPDNWVIIAGTVTTNIGKDATNKYTGTNAVKLIGSGGTAAHIAQPLNTSTSTSAGVGGSPQKLASRTPYAVSLWTAVHASAPAAGVLRVALVDGTNTVINDDAGNANSFAIDLTAETTAFANHTGVFRLPSSVPSTVKLSLFLSTDITSGKFVTIDHLCLAKMTELYTGGPFLSIFSSSTPLVKNDRWTAAVTNTWGVFQQYFERSFGMRALGLQLPSSGSPTIADSLVA